MPTVMTPIRVDLAVGAGGGARVAARVVTPELTAARALEIPIWLFCLPGFGGDWRYWNAEIPGLPADAYNAAQFFARRGIGTIAIDVFASGDSEAAVDAAKLGFTELADAHHQARTSLRERLGTGGLIDGLPPQSPIALVGLGFSGGGALVLIQQALHRSFDFVADLGLAVGPLGGFRAGADYDSGGRPPASASLRVDERGCVTLPQR